MPSLSPMFSIFIYCIILLCLLMLHMCVELYNKSWNLESWTNNKNLGKRVKNQNHKCTIHRNTTNSSIPLDSYIQLSTKTEQEQVIIQKTCNNEQIEFLCV
jgi:hypothetical protein